MLTFVGAICFVNAENSGLWICIDRFILIFIKYKGDFGIAQDTVLRHMPVPVTLPKMHPKKGVLVQGLLFLFLLRVMHTHICISCGVCTRRSQSIEGWVFSRSQFTPKAFLYVCCGLVLSLHFLPPAWAKDKLLSLNVLNLSMFDISKQKIDGWNVKQLVSEVCYFVIDSHHFFNNKACFKDVFSVSI